MKIQDIIFLTLFVFLVHKMNPKWSAIFGMFSLFAAIPLFTFWVFFTAERLIWYAAAFFLLCIAQHVIKK